LRTVPGVAEINAWGGREKQYHVVIDPELLLKHEITLDELVLALRRNVGSTGGGVVSTGGESVLVQGLALATGPRDVEEVVLAALFVFLGDLRAGLIVALAIPLSLLFAFSLMLKLGIAGTLMSLGAIDFGLVVDSSVIVVESAARRLASDRSGRSVVEVVRD